VAWLKDAGDVTKLSATQDSLLDAAVRLVRTGGIILYCTCSLQPEEGAERIAAALKRHASLARIPIRPEELFDFKELVTPDGDLRSLPSHLAQLGGIDGFYAARLIKQG
jgi:16S rRNA (cytosine967-C5)-methyltransferase